MKKVTLTLLILAFLFQSRSMAQCTVPAAGNSGIGTYVTNQYSYLNCHRYIRTALLNNGVNLNTGNFNSSPIIHPSSSAISSDDRFVIVCNKNDAQAICFTHLSGQPDHSALVLNPGIITGASGSFASTPGSGSSVYKHGEASIGSGGGTLLNYFAVVPEVGGSGSISNGQTQQYCLAQKNYMQSISWSVSSPSLQIVGSTTSFCANVKANCSVGSGTFYVIATITIAGTGEVRQVKKAVSVTCPPANNCFGNTLDGGSLYTFNYISTGTTHTIQMAMNWTWTLSSGSPSVYQVLNNGKTVMLGISSGCVTLRAYNSSCGTHTYTFCPGSSFTAEPDQLGLYRSDAEESINALETDISLYPNPASDEVYLRYNKDHNYRIRIYNRLGQVVQQQENTDRIALSDFENGTYLFEIQDLDTRQKVVKRIVVLK